MANVRWGLMGATVIGREWMIGALREAGGDIVAVMSTDAQRGGAYAQEFAIPKSVSSLTEPFSAGIDAVYIATTNERHRGETVAAAEAGVHVLCEKPLATRLADARLAPEPSRGGSRRNPRPARIERGRWPDPAGDSFGGAGERPGIRSVAIAIDA